MPMDRRGFLGTLALAPAAMAACATPAAAAKAGPGAAAPAPAPPPVAGPATPGLDAVRDHPLPGSAEPAFTFRAAPARPGEG